MLLTADLARLLADRKMASEELAAAGVSLAIAQRNLSAAQSCLAITQREHSAAMKCLQKHLKVVLQPPYVHDSLLAPLLMLAALCCCRPGARLHHPATSEWKRR